MRAPLALLLSLAASLAAPAEAQAQAQRAPTASRAVYVGVYLRDVSRFEQRSGVFDADFDMWAKWRGELDPALITLGNAARVNREFLGEESDGTWHSARWRVRGTLRGEFPLHRFPFDRQELPIVFELAESYGRLVPDLASSSMAESFSLTDWNYEPTFHPDVSQRVLTSDLGHLAHESQPTTLDRVAFRVRMVRPLMPVVLKLFVPLLIILLVAMASLFVHPSQTAARVSMTVTALLACFAFQFTVADSLPAVTYVTLADILFLIGYALCGITVVTAITTVGLLRGGHVRSAAWVDRGLRVVLPAAGIAAVVFALPPEPPRPPILPEPIPEMARHESARDVLRIGTNLMRSVTGSPVAFAANWGLVHEDPIDGEQVVAIERAPGVGNDSLHILAGGGVRVTWTLREGATWSDGAALTSGDLAFQERVTPDPEIAGVETPDAQTYVVRWTHALARALDAPGASPEHVFGDTFEEGGYDAVRDRRRAEVYPTIGPYRLTEYVAGERLLAERNPSFLGAPSNIARVELIHVERDQLGAAFERGDIDMTAPNAITPETAEDVATRRPEAVVHRPSALFLFLDLDLGVPALASLENRRALLSAIDRAGLARAIYGDHGRVAHIPVPGVLPPEVETIGHDPAAARAVLEPLELTLPLYATDSPIDQALAARMTEELAEVGVTLEITIVPSTLRKAREGDHGGMVMRITRGRRDHDPRYWWALQRVEGHYPPEARNPAYTDAMQQMVEREERALYPERREQLRDALFAAYAARLPSIPLIFAAERILVDPSLRGWDLPPDVAFGVGVERWWFAPSAE